MIYEKELLRFCEGFDGIGWLGPRAVRAILSWIQAFFWDIQADMKWFGRSS